MAAYIATTLSPPPSLPWLVDAYAVGPLPWPAIAYTAIKFGPGVQVRIWDAGTSRWIIAPSG